MIAVWPGHSLKVPRTARIHGGGEVEKTTTTTTGVSVFGLLGIVFVVLKLTGFIDWSWWWVTLPFWGGMALVVSLLAVAAFVILLIVIIDR